MDQPFREPACQELHDLPVLGSGRIVLDGAVALHEAMREPESAEW